MKLVTYNIQYAKGRDGRFDLGRIARAVDGADVIALQEVERHWPRSGMADHRRRSARCCPATTGSTARRSTWTQARRRATARS